jgi:phosphomannomutase
MKLVLVVVLASTSALRRVATPTAQRPWLAVTRDADTALALRALSGAAKDDVRGIARPDAAVPILPACTYWIGAAFRRWLGSTDPIAVGRDPRVSSEDLSIAFCRGAEACDAGPATTPAMLESLLGPSAGYAGSVFVTASHLPSEWNGLKLFSRQLGRGLNKVDQPRPLTLALNLTLNPDPDPNLKQAEVKQVMELAVQLGDGAVDATRDGPAAVDATSSVPVQDDFMGAYVEKLRAAVREAAGGDGEAPLRGMRVCVNPGNGAGGFFASAVLAPLGADTSASINLQPDGTFPAHMPNPEDREHERATTAAVGVSGAEVGVMLDTDVDRCGLIDGMRSPPEPVNKNRLIALCARVALEAAGGKGVIVTDPVTSAGMASYIASCGGQHDRFMMGYRNVIDRAADTQPEPALLAIETSGHSAWKDNRFVDDGTYTAARLIGRLARARREQGNPQLGLLDLVGDSLQEPRESIKVKMAVAAGLSGVPEAEAALCEALRRTAAATDGWDMEPVNHDGLRCAVEAAGGSGWLIIRGSLHEPSVSVQTESDVAGGTATICEQLLRFEQGACEAAGIDLQPLRDQAAAAAAAAAATAATPEGAASTARTGGGPRMSAAVGGASRSSTCRVCRSSYDPSDNGPLACRFHPGSLRGESLCGRQPRTGFGQFALQHAPPAPDRAQGGPQPRPASANWQIRSGWLAGHTGLVFPIGESARKGNWEGVRGPDAGRGDDLVYSWTCCGASRDDLGCTFDRCRSYDD